MIIDSHQHFWSYHPERHAWISEEMEILKRDYLPRDLEPVLKAQGVDGCVAVQAEMSEQETLFLLESARKHPFIKGVVGWVDLRMPDAGNRLEYFSAYPALKGLRHIVQDEPDDQFMLRPDFQNGIGLLARFGLTYDILIYPWQLPAALALVRQFPGQQFVLDHLAKPRISDGLDIKWQRQIRELASHPNVFCKLSGMVTETRDFQWTKEEFKPFMDTVLRAFGPERLLFGSDWPVCLLAASYAEVAGIVRSYLQSLSETEQLGIMGGNAIRFYDL